MRIRLGGLLCSILALGLLVAGCGGGGDDVSRSAFLKEGNALCVKSNVKAGTKILAAYQRPILNDTKVEAGEKKLEATIFMPIVVEDVESQLSGLQDLGTPGGDEDKVEAIIDAYEAWLEEAEKQPYKVLIANNFFNDARQLTREYGLIKCARTPFEEPYVHN